MPTQRPGLTTWKSRRDERPRRVAEDGFSIVEATIALGLVFTILVGMLATISTSVRGVVHSRQQSVAVNLAREVLEQTHALAYSEVGHDLNDDPTLGTDSALTSTGTYAWTYEGQRLAGSSINWATRDPDLPSPFYPHERTVERNATTYTTRVYVTHINPAEYAEAGVPHKLISVHVDWDSAQHGTDTYEVSLELTDKDQPPDPLLQGLSDIDGGVISITGYVENLDLEDAFLWLPYSHGEVDSRFIRRVNGFAAGARSQLNVDHPLTTDDLIGCTVTNNIRTAECRGVKATTVADNDEGTAPGPHDQDGPLTGVGGTIRRTNVFGITLNSGASGAANVAESSGSAAACGTPCPAPYAAYSYPENDAVPYHESESSGPASFLIFFQAGGVSGNIAAASLPAIAHSVVDRDDISGTGRIAASGEISHPAIRVLSFASAVYDLLGLSLLASYDGMVRIGATSASVSAEAGPGAQPPSLSGSNVLVEVFDTCNSPLPGYISRTMTPGVPDSVSGCTDVTVANRRVRMETTVTTTDEVVKTDYVGATYYDAEVSATSWLQAVTRLTVYGNGGQIVADLTIDVDYGRLLARAKYREGGQ